MNMNEGTIGTQRNGKRICDRKKYAGPTTIGSRKYLMFHPANYRIAKKIATAGEGTVDTVAIEARFKSACHARQTVWAVLLMADDVRSLINIGL